MVSGTAGCGFKIWGSGIRREDFITQFTQLESGEGLRYNGPTVPVKGSAMGVMRVVRAVFMTGAGIFLHRLKPSKSDDVSVVGN